MSYIYEYKPATKGRYWGLPNIAVKGLVLHSIGTPQPKADPLVSDYNTLSATASVHGFIEPGRYVETAPCRLKKGQAKKCYHVGGGYNDSRIGIEMTEPATIRYVGGATYKDLNPAKTLEHIKAVVATAVEVFGDLCIFHDLDPSQICSHAEAYQKRQGSNHGDPNHLFRQSWPTYNMDKFRSDVRNYIAAKKGDVLANMTKQEFDAAIAELKPAKYTYLSDVPSWAQSAINKCINKGYISGTGTDKNGMILNVSEDFVRTMVVLERAGVFDLSR